jgi:hypothetical protein
VEEAESNFAVKFSMQGSADLPDLTGNQVNTLEHCEALKQSVPEEEF